MSNDIPADVKDFIGNHIHSVAQLEILLMLRSEPERSWTSVEINKSLYLNSDMLTQLLTDIVQRGFAAQAECCFRYQPANDTDRQLIERLAQVYQERRVAVIAEIFSKPTDFIKAFANAFRLRKEE